MATKVKADRLLLIKALKAEQKKVEAEHKLATEKYDIKRAKYCVELATFLEKLAIKVRGGYLPLRTRYGGEPELTGFPVMPEKPASTPATCELKRQIATLELSKEETILVDEASVYVKFACAV